MAARTEMPEWRALEGLAAAARGRHLRELFAGDPGRAERFSLEAEGLLLDWSKTRIDDDIWRALLDLARACDLAGARRALFAGEKVNVTEGRAAFHMALRNRSDAAMSIDGEDVMPGVGATLDAMGDLVRAVHSGAWRGATGKKVRRVVHIGIGGSHLGPEAAVLALAPYARPGIEIRFVANIDGNDLVRALDGAEPETTLFIVASKTFTTRETMVNAASARNWLVAALGETSVARHFLAASTNAQAVANFGIDAANMFGFADWVGGRYSLWSAIGLPIMLAIGPEHFLSMLDGAHAMDVHFRDAPDGANLPVILGLLGVWQGSFEGAASRALLPYDQRLDRLVDHLQQLDMESNGKRIDREGRVVDCKTGTVLWGRAGTNGQHAFYQLLHQGTHFVPCEIIAVAEPGHDLAGHHAILLANALAQAEALMLGKSEAAACRDMLASGMAEADARRLAPHRSFPGNVPTSFLLLPRLDPFRFGQLVALWEHRVFVEGAIWNINSFDQWGVELGKTLAGRLETELASGEAIEGHDSSTRALAERLRQSLRAQTGAGS